MDTAIQIRARRVDVPLLLNFIKELADYEHMSDQEIATEPLLEEWIFDKQKAEVLVAELGGAPAGFALFFHSFSTFLGRAGLFLEDLYVRPEYRDRGVGKALIARLAALTVERGCGRLEWNCLDWNEPSVGFYRALGAQPMSDWTTYRLTGDALEAVSQL